MDDIVAILAGVAIFALLLLYIPACEKVQQKMLDLYLGGAISAGLLIYLVWAMLRPEDF